MRDVVALGTPFMDYLVHIDHLPTKKDEGARILQTSWQGGGKVSSALAALGQLGRNGSMMGVIGSDSYGDFLLRDYERFNIDVSHMIRDGANSFSLVLSDKITQGRNIIGRRGTGRKYTVEDIDEPFVRDHRMLHLERADAPSHRLADIMHDCGGLVAFDGDGFSEETQAMLPKIDVFIGSEFYYKALFGESENYRENMLTLQRKGVKIVVFTLGDKGSVALWNGGYRFCPGYKIDVVDTLGASDVYHGGYLFALLEGMDPGECAQFANAVAAIKCMGIGGRANTPNYQMVRDFMATGDFDRTLVQQKTAFYANFSVK